MGIAAAIIQWVVYKFINSSVIQWVVYKFINSSVARWIYGTEELERERITRLSQEFYDSSKSIIDSTINLEQSIQQHTDVLTDEHDVNEAGTILNIFEAMLRKFQCMTTSLSRSDVRDEISKRLDKKDCIETLLDDRVTFGRKLSLLRQNCQTGNRGFVIVYLAMHFELGLGRINPQITNVCAQIRKSHISKIHFKQLLRNSNHIKQSFDADGEHFKYVEICKLLERVVEVLIPICEDFSLNVSKMTTALDDRFQDEEDDN